MRFDDVQGSRSSRRSARRKTDEPASSHGSWKRDLKGRWPALLSASALASLSLVGTTWGTSGASVKVAGAKSAASNTPYDLHAILSLTGPVAALGQEEKASLEALQTLVNKTGGIKGHPLNIEISDNESTPALSVSLATPLIGKVPALLVGSIQATNEPVDALTHDGSTVVYDLSPGDQPKFHSYVYSAGPGTQASAFALVNYFKAKGWDRIAVINSTDASGAGGWTSMQKALHQEGGKKVTVVSHETFDPTATSVTTQMSIIHAANPQAIVAWTTGAPVVTVFQGMKQEGMDGIPVLATYGNADSGLLKHVGAALLPTTTMFVAPVFLGGAQKLSSAEHSAVSDFVNSLNAQGVQIPSAGNGLSWDPGLILVSALRKFGPTATAKQIHGYIDGQTHFAGAMGTYNFKDSKGTTANRGLGPNSMVIIQWNPATNAFVRISGLDGKHPS